MYANCLFEKTADAKIDVEGIEEFAAGFIVAKSSYALPSFCPLLDCKYISLSILVDDFLRSRVWRR